MSWTRDDKSCTREMFTHALLSVTLLSPGKQKPKVPTIKLVTGIGFCMCFAFSFLKLIGRAYIGLHLKYYNKQMKNKSWIPLHNYYYHAASSRWIRTLHPTKKKLRGIGKKKPSKRGPWAVLLIWKTVQYLFLNLKIWRSF